MVIGLGELPGEILYKDVPGAVQDRLNLYIVWKYFPCENCTEC